MAGNDVNEGVHLVERAVGFKIGKGKKYYFEIFNEHSVASSGVCELQLTLGDTVVDLFVPCIRRTTLTLEQFETKTGLLSAVGDGFRITQRVFAGLRGRLASRLALSPHLTGQTSVFAYVALSTLFNNMVLGRSGDFSSSSLHRIARASRDLSMLRAAHKTLTRTQASCDPGRSLEKPTISVLIKSHNFADTLWMREIQSRAACYGSLRFIDARSNSNYPETSGLFQLCAYVYFHQPALDDIIIYFELAGSDGSLASNVLEWLLNQAAVERVFGEQEMFLERAARFQRDSKMGLLLCHRPPDRDERRDLLFTLKTIPNFLSKANEHHASYRQSFTQAGFWLRLKALTPLWHFNFSRSNANFVRDRILVEELEKTMHIVVQQNGFKAELARLPEPVEFWTEPRAVSEAIWIPVRRLESTERKRVALFVTLVSESAVSPIAQRLSRAIKSCGFDVIIVAVQTDLATTVADPGADVCEGIYARSNEGYDFGAWATAIKKINSLRRCECLLLLNDSIIGPVGDLRAIVQKCVTSEADVIALTASTGHKLHSQSYFTLFKQRAVESLAFSAFWNAVKSLSSKEEVIQAYELEMMSKLEEGGLQVQALFPAPGPDLNPTHHLWRQLLDAGFPFVKAELLRDNPTGVDLTGWRDVFLSAGWDPDEVINHLKVRRLRPAACDFS